MQAKLSFFTELRTELERAVMMLDYVDFLQGRTQDINQQPDRFFRDGFSLAFCYEFGFQMQMMDSDLVVPSSRIQMELLALDEISGTSEDTQASVVEKMTFQYLKLMKVLREDIAGEPGSIINRVSLQNDELRQINRSRINANFVSGVRFAFRVVLNPTSLCNLLE